MGALFCHERASNEADRRDHIAGVITMLLSFIIARLRAKPAYVWKPAVTMTDSRIVSELTGTAS